MIRSLWLGAGTSLLAVAAAMPAAAQSGRQTGAGSGGRQVTIAPYIEASQSLSADLNGDSDVVTYTSVAAGIDVAASTPRVEAQLSYRYEHNFAWSHNAGDSDIHSGLARAAAKVAPGLTIEGGALATRARSDIRGAAPGLLISDNTNVTEVYSLYAGPTLSTSAGPVAINGAYRIGYTKVEAPNSTGIGTGQPRLDYFDHSLGQSAVVSAGVSPGSVLPVGLTASAGYDREDAGQLDQRYQDFYARGDALLPVSPTLAIAGGVGYEKLTTSSRAPVLTAAGVPVVDDNGRFVTNKSAPRRIDYRTDGLYYDAGVVWRPNHRTSLGAYVGRRYGSWSYTGNFTYQGGRGIGLSINLYDSVQTFGRQLRQGLSNLPTSFIAARNAYTQQYNGCVFSTGGTTPGGCLNDVFQSISTASYRARGVDAVLSISRGMNTFGVGAGYANRELYQPNYVPGVRLYGLDDESYYAQAFYGRQLSSVDGVQANVFVNYYDPAIAFAPETWGYGATASYYRNFGQLSTTATVGLFGYDQGDLRSQLSAQALLGARYTF
jgi:hypothetical protein